MTGLIAKPNFEDIAAKLDSPFEIKKPDRLAKFILESPTLASFDETGISRPRSSAERTLRPKRPR